LWLGRGVGGGGEAIWNFCEGPGLPSLGIGVWGTEGPVLRLRGIGTDRAQNNYSYQSFIYSPTDAPVSCV